MPIGRFCSSRRCRSKVLQAYSAEPVVRRRTAGAGLGYQPSRLRTAVAPVSSGADRMRSPRAPSGRCAHSPGGAAMYKHTARPTVSWGGTGIATQPRREELLITTRRPDSTSRADAAAARHSVRCSLAAAGNRTTWPGVGQKPDLLGARLALSQPLRLCGVLPARACRRTASARSSSVNSPDHIGCPISCSSVSSGRPRRTSHGVTTSM